VVFSEWGRVKNCGTRKQGDTRRGATRCTLSGKGERVYAKDKRNQGTYRPRLKRLRGVAEQRRGHPWRLCVALQTGRNSCLAVWVALRRTYAVVAMGVCRTPRTPMCISAFTVDPPTRNLLSVGCIEKILMGTTTVWHGCRKPETSDQANHLPVRFAGVKCWGRRLRCTTEVG